MQLELVALVVQNYGRAKRWVIVRPPGAVTGMLLALERQARTQEGPWTITRW